jgi:hypothetical protein
MFCCRLASGAANRYCFLPASFAKLAAKVVNDYRLGIGASLAQNQKASIAADVVVRMSRVSLGGDEHHPMVTLILRRFLPEVVRFLATDLEAVAGRSN